MSEENNNTNEDLKDAINRASIILKKPKSYWADITVIIVIAISKEKTAI